MEEKTKTLYSKVCRRCRKSYTSTARHQKFCTDECRIKYNKSTLARRKEYAKNAEHERVRVASHVLGVQRMELEGPVKACAMPECGSEVEIELHHMDGDVFNNSFCNIVWLCKKCHAKTHSLIKETLKEKPEAWLGETLEDRIWRRGKLSEMYKDLGIGE